VSKSAEVLLLRIGEHDDRVSPTEA
jgi:hypothetical protein